MNNSKRIYRAAIYVRLSKEDGDLDDVRKAESNSISNQKSLILNYLKDKEDIEIVSIREDDGYSGATFDRPAFKPIRKAWPLFNQSEPILIHNVDILSNVDLKKFYQMESRDMIAARLMVSERKTKRYLLFDDSMRLVGWTNIETGEVKSPYPDLNPKDYKMYAFSGIHMVAPSLFPLMEEEPDKFPIMDFYLKHCDKVRIEGYVKNDLKLMDVGKQETLKEAEAFLKSLGNSL